MWTVTVPIAHTGHIVHTGQVAAATLLITLAHTTRVPIIQVVQPLQAAQQTRPIRVVQAAKRVQVALTELEQLADYIQRPTLSKRPIRLMRLGIVF